jgi:hypothetical protein
MALLTSVSRAGAGTTATRDTTGAKILVAAYAYSDGSGVAPTDSESNVWTPIVGSLSDFSGAQALWAVLDPVTSATHDFTIGGTVPAGIFAAFSAATSLQLDDQVLKNFAPSPATTGSLTSSANDALFVTGMGGTNNGGSSIDLSFTVVDEVPVNGGVNFGIAMAYLELGTAAAKNPEWTFGGAFENGLTMGVWVPFVAPGGSTWPGYIAPFGWQ